MRCRGSVGIVRPIGGRVKYGGRKMTAKELHDLYAPVWELVPETIPLWLHYDATAEPCWVLEGEADDFGVIRTETAAALCRVAAEDWAMAHGFTIKTTSRDLPWRTDAVGLFRGEAVEGTEWHYAMTIHHALTAAVRAVATTTGHRRSTGD